MNRQMLLVLTGLAVIFLVSASCSDQQQETKEDGTNGGYDSLIESLEAEGLSVAPGDTVSQPFFTPPGQTIDVGDQIVQVFEYASAEEASHEASLVAPDGSSVGTSMMTWIATPHFYSSGNVIALYVGEDAALTAHLETILGPQFAGG